MTHYSTKGLVSLCGKDLARSKRPANAVSLISKVDCAACLDAYNKRATYKKQEESMEQVAAAPTEEQVRNSTIEIQKEYTRTVREVSNRIDTAIMRVKTWMRPSRIVESQQLHLQKLAKLKRAFEELGLETLL